MSNNKLRDLIAVTVNKFSGIAVSLVVTPLAGRLMTREEFGVWAISMTISAFSSILSGGGVNTFIVREKDLGNEKISTAFWAGIGLSVSVTAIMLALVYPISSFLGMRDWMWVFAAVISLIPIATSTGQLNALLRRNKRFTAITSIGLITSLLHLIVTAGLLLRGYGVWAFAIAAAVNSTISLWLHWRLTRFKPLFVIDRACLREIVLYCRGLVAFSSINFWARNADNLIIGKVLGAAALGYYAVTYRLMMLPLTHVLQLFNALLLTYLSPYQDRPDIVWRHFATTLQAIGLISIPPMTLLWLNTDLFLRLYLGPGWEVSADLLRILAPVGMYQVILSPLGTLYMVSGNNDRFFRIGLLNSSVTVLGFAIGAFWGLTGVAVSYVIANAVMMYPNVTMAVANVQRHFIDWIRTVASFLLIPFLGITMHVVFLRFFAERELLVFDAAVILVVTLFLMLTQMRETADRLIIELKAGLT